MGPEIGAEAALHDGVVFKQRLRRASCQELRVESSASLDRRCSNDAIAATGLVVVGGALVIEHVITEHDVVRARTLARQKIVGLHIQIVVVALFVPADPAEGRAPVPQVVCEVAHERAVDQILACRPGPMRCRVAVGDACLDEQCGRQHAVVIHRKKILRCLTRKQALQVHDIELRSAVVDLITEDLCVRTLKTLVRVVGIRQLAFVALLLITKRIRRVEDSELSRRILARNATSSKEPQMIFQNRTAYRVLVGRDRKIEAGVARVYGTFVAGFVAVHAANCGGRRHCLCPIAGQRRPRWKKGI